ncbi:MAG: type II secretion system protein [Candidatus Margulisbacteria bacterium]|nr:type II secretion system protein [Candidatus Margulisiibacteriota bacterium]
MTYTPKNRQGFTLVELLVTFMVGLILMTSVVPAFLVIQKRMGYLTREMIYFHEWAYVSHFIETDLKTLHETLFITPIHVQFVNIKGETISYSLKNNRIKRRANRHTAYLNKTLDIRSLHFEKQGKGMIHIRFRSSLREHHMAIHLPNEKET